MCMRRTSTPDDIDDSDVYVISDAGKQGNKNLLLNSLVNRENKPVKKTVRTLTLILGEESLLTGGDKKGTAQSTKCSRGTW